MKEYQLRSEISDEASKSLNIYDQLTQTLLLSRGINTTEEAETFFYPNYEKDLHDPFLLFGMKEAVERILLAIEKNEKILIYSDYDADGIPGGVILREFFEKINYKNSENYIPDRHQEGYGVHLDAVEGFGKNGVSLLITIDCGICDTVPIARARELGIDVIITDHHEQNGLLPNANIIINPKQKNCNYPYIELCGSGVVFKLIQGILLKNNFGLKAGAEKWFLDLVGIATLSDMVPLTGENRVLAHYGLKVLRKSPRPGLQKIWKKLKIEERNITEEDITFSLAPRLNAASRMGHPVDTFKLLITRDETEADITSDYLNKINDERKGAVATIVKEIHKHMKERETLRSVFVIGNPLWKPALLGIVATRIMDDIRRPIFIWGRNGDNEIKGSCRSDGTVNTVLLMDAVKDSLVSFGGHKLAGGFSATNDQIHTLEEKLNVAYEKIKESKIDNADWLEAILDLDKINWDLYKVIEKFSPFGVGNPKPKFMLKNVKPKFVKMFGKEKNHLELTFESAKGKIIKGISFFSNPDSFQNKPEEGKPLDVVATLEKSLFRNFPELRLRIIDII